MQRILSSHARSLDLAREKMVSAQRVRLTIYQPANLTLICCFVLTFFIYCFVFVVFAVSVCLFVSLRVYAYALHVYACVQCVFYAFMCVSLCVLAAILRIKAGNGMENIYIYIILYCKNINNMLMSN